MDKFELLEDDNELLFPVMECITSIVQVCVHTLLHLSVHDETAFVCR
jgi:hypothetical protein